MLARQQGAVINFTGCWESVSSSVVQNVRITRLHKKSVVSGRVIILRIQAVFYHRLWLAMLTNDILEVLFLKNEESEFSLEFPFIKILQLCNNCSLYPKSDYKKW